MQAVFSLIGRWGDEGLAVKEETMYGRLKSPKWIQDRKISPLKPKKRAQIVSLPEDLMLRWWKKKLLYLCLTSIFSKKEKNPSAVNIFWKDTKKTPLIKQSSKEDYCCEGKRAKIGIFMRFFGEGSSTLAWKIPWTEEPGRLQSMGSLRVRHDWETSLSLLTFLHWRRKWQPTPVFLPGESQGPGSLVGCRLWGRTELATTEAT